MYGRRRPGRENTEIPLGVHRVKKKELTLQLFPSEKIAKETYKVQIIGFEEIECEIIDLRAGAYGS
jgi:hypothetical protein